MNNIAVEKLTLEISNNTNRLSVLETSRQPFVSDWFDINVSSFSVSSAPQIDLIDIDGTKKFNIGDKVRLQQDSEIKYFYIVKTTASTITLDAGDDYDLGSSNIERFEISRNTNPSGFPLRGFHYTPTITSSGLGSVTIDSIDNYYTLSGGLITTTSNATVLVTPSAGPGFLIETLPLTADISGGSGLFYPSFVSSSRGTFSPIGARGVINSSLGNEKYQLGEFTASGSGGIDYAYSVTYPIAN